MTDTDMDCSPTQTEYHQCCGCSCDVCAEGHNSLRPMRGHTTECFLRFMDEHASTPQNVDTRTESSGDRYVAPPTPENVECPNCGGKGWWWCDIDDDRWIRQRCACGATPENVETSNE